MSAIAICNNPRGKRGEEIGPHCPLLLYAGGSEGPETTVQVEQRCGEYVITNRYYDGVVGVDSTDAVDAEADDSPICGECGAPIEQWQHEQKGRAA